MRSLAASAFDGLLDLIRSPEFWLAVGTVLAIFGLIPEEGVGPIADALLDLIEAILTILSLLGLMVVRGIRSAVRSLS